MGLAVGGWTEAAGVARGALHPQVYGDVAGVLRRNLFYYLDLTGG